MLSLKSGVILAGLMCFLTLAVFGAGYVRGKEAGRLGLWLEQRQAIGIKDNEAIVFPSGAILYSNGVIEYRVEAKSPNELTSFNDGSQCAICHQT